MIRAPLLLLVGALTACSRTPETPPVPPPNPPKPAPTPAPAPAPTPGGRRLVEVFDNGPIGVRPDGTTGLLGGPSEGYIWVDAEALPPPGKSWAPVDPAALTAEQKKRIRNRK